MYAAQLVFALYLVLPVASHIALWDPAMYGWDPADPNQNDAVTPLADLPFDQWWFHGYINQPPASGVFMDLPSGGTYHGQVACNKAQTTYGGSLGTDYACEQIGPLHTTDNFGDTPKDVMGCGLAIAYQSDVNKIQPEDFSVISVNYECPWKKNVDFEIPSDLPPCPEGGCHCLWGWVHNSDSGSEQNYILGYRCNVTGATGTRPLPLPNTANKCDYPSDTSNCTVGAKQPHYWYQAERNNNFQDTYDPPFYNGKYGYMNGAQTDLFAGQSSVSSAASIPASISSATTIASSSVTTTSPSPSPSTTSTTPSTTSTTPSTTSTTPSTTSTTPSTTSTAPSTTSTTPSTTSTTPSTTRTTTTARIAGHTAVPDDESSSSLTSTSKSGSSTPYFSSLDQTHTHTPSSLSSGSQSTSTSGAYSSTSTAIAASLASASTPLSPTTTANSNSTLVVPTGTNATTTTGSGKICRRRKRALDRMEDPEVRREHEERQARRVQRRLLKKAPKKRAEVEEGMARHKRGKRVVRRHRTRG